MIFKAVCLIAVCIAVIIQEPFDVYAGEPYTGRPGEYYIWADDEAVDDNTGLLRSTPVHFDFVTNGKKKVTTYEWRTVLTGADAVWFGDPHVISCGACREKVERATNLYTVRIFLMDDTGREILSRSGVRLGPADLGTTGIDFDTYTTPLRVCIEIEQKPGDWCGSCNTHIGDNITVDGIYCHRTCLVVDKAPADVTVDSGSVASFSIRLSRYVMTQSADPRSFYRWVIKEDDGTWRWLYDGAGSYDESYSGVSTPNLTVSNVTGKLHNKEYAVAMNGTYGNIVYSSPATLKVNGCDPDPDPDPGTDPDPDPSPSPDPDPAPDPDPSPAPEPNPKPDPSPVPKPDPSPVPDPSSGTGGGNTPSPSQGTDPTPIIPQGGGSSSYKPSTSSSAYVSPSPSSGGSSSNRPGPSSSSSSSSKNHRTDDDSHYSGSISTPVIPGTGEKITAETIASAGAGSATSGSKTGTSVSGGKAGSSAAGSKTGSSGKGTGQNGSSAAGSSTSVAKKPNSSTFMKNGILYVVDDESGNNNVGTKGELTKKEEPDVTSVENENAYSAADLATYGDLTEQEMEKGFFDTVPGYIVIILSALLVLLLALFFLFFGVIVFGEVEEHDEVFELCAIRLMKRRDGNWCINLSALFDDNAVVRLRIGLLFAVIFDGWDLTGDTNGVYEGTVTGRIAQNMEMHRKDVRRSV